MPQKKFLSAVGLIVVLGTARGALAWPPARAIEAAARSAPPRNPSRLNSFSVFVERAGMDMRIILREIKGGEHGRFDRLISIDEELMGKVHSAILRTFSFSL